MRYCGRNFTGEELEWICLLLAEQPQLNRAQLSRALCRHLGWYKADGKLKEMSCRVAMLRMQADGLITLPAPQNGNGNGRVYARRTQATDPGLPIDQPVGIRASRPSASRTIESDDPLSGLKPL